MEPSSPCASSLSANHQAVSSLDDLAVHQNLLLSDGLKGLKSMRSQLYSAAEYFELSYINDERKEVVMRTLKEYAVEAIINAVDHLGSVSHKVNNLLNEEVDEVSVAESQVSCIEQRLRSCQACIDQEGFSQQTLFIRTPKYHKHYIRQDEAFADSSILPMIKYELYPPEENRKQQRHQTGLERRHRPSPVTNARSRSPSPSPSVRELSSLPRHVRSTSTLPLVEKVFSKERRSISPLRSSGPLMRARSVANMPSIPNSSRTCSPLLESLNSLPMNLGAEQNKEAQRSQTKKKGFLKSLLSRNKAWTDESLYSYLDEY